MAGFVIARVVVPHQDLDTGKPSWDVYHEWYCTGERVKADRLGRGNPRMYVPFWTKWKCYNGDCAAWALVSDDAGLRAIREAGG